MCSLATHWLTFLFVSENKTFYHGIPCKYSEASHVYNSNYNKYDEVRLSVREFWIFSGSSRIIMLIENKNSSKSCIVLFYLPITFHTVSSESDSSELLSSLLDSESLESESESL